MITTTTTTTTTTTATITDDDDDDNNNNNGIGITDIDTLHNSQVNKKLLSKQLK